MTRERLRRGLGSASVGVTGGEGVGDKAQSVPSALLRGCQGRGGEEQGMQTERE